MNNGQIQAGGDKMTKSNQRSHFEASVRAKAVAFSAVLLISVGIVIELGELAYARICAANAWFISTVVGNLWNAFATFVHEAGGPDVVRFLPLLFVMAGIVLLTSVRRSRIPAAVVVPRNEKENG